MRYLLPLLVLAGACTSPEALTAQKFLGCLADDDRPCLRRLHAPLIARLASWGAATKVERLFVGRFARRAMQDADNPFWALYPVSCARSAHANRLPESTKSDLADCSCKVTSRQQLAPAAPRLAAFMPLREQARKTHPAMEILGIRSTAEAIRVTTLVTATCRCQERRIEVALLDLQGRVPRWRYFKATGVCEAAPPGVLAKQIAQARRLLSGKLQGP